MVLQDFGEPTPSLVQKPDGFTSPARRHQLVPCSSRTYVRRSLGRNRLDTRSSDCSVLESKDSSAGCGLGCPHSDEEYPRQEPWSERLRLSRRDRPRRGRQTGWTSLRQPIRPNSTATRSGRRSALYPQGASRAPPHQKRAEPLALGGARREGPAAAACYWRKAGLANERSQHLLSSWPRFGLAVRGRYARSGASFRGRLSLRAGGSLA
jgi:hypothetical protein